MLSLRRLVLILFALASGPAFAQPGDPTPARWQLLPGGGIVWDVEAEDRLPHEDHIEMSGRHLSAIIQYGVGEDGEWVLSRRVIWPTLRTLVPPDEPWWKAYRSYLDRTYDDVDLDVTVDGEPWTPGRVDSVVIDGTLRIAHAETNGLALERVLFPSPDTPHLFERWTLRTSRPLELAVASRQLEERVDGYYGPYLLETASGGLVPQQIEAGQEVTVALAIGARRAVFKPTPARSLVALAERRAYVSEVSRQLVLRTPDPVLNEAFRLAKVRTAESLFETKMGLVHSPGGASYYGGVWANDQVEYAGPFFPFLGYAPANEASLTAYRVFAADMKPDYSALTSSFEIQGDLTCCGSDRGDASMYAYGASRFALALGDRSVADELWPAIAWSLEYARRQTTPEGVIASDSDEMEGRLPTGDANLSTTTLTYGGLRTAAALARDLGHADSARVYTQRADALAAAIESHFGATVEGYETYRYFDGNDTLRHWINLPLTMGLYDRKEGTLAALFEVLWTPDGLDVQTDAGSFWDRSTLYALRGVFNAGETELALQYLTDYTRRRLLGDHVPYPVEAYPEGGQAHLAAESALYGRVFIEGLFGIEPTGLASFTVTPRLPEAWPEMCLERVQAFGAQFDVCVSRQLEAVRVEVVREGQSMYDRTERAGETHEIAFR